MTPDELEGVLEQGESVQGNVCMQPDEDDTDLLLAIELFSDDDFEEVVGYFALE